MERRVETQRYDLGRYTLLTDGRDFYLTPGHQAPGNFGVRRGTTLRIEWENSLGLDDPKVQRTLQVCTTL